ncbi:unnamed protein product [Rotaria magnacalcarata]|uniref:Saposin B-type domain-containing protein n=2 Tax=Rotaria magnacalcarata TaxID=392030 RepID=A0A819Z5M9_9BILA|nr:unnamed protein product [Rotaria magnacalcarata]CAF1640633.1 unnamed protein product [Rotaria magnacalcarata]CAF2103912.1 unnamed protein product [Rotaria magnacalcarata]CAF2249530.1 unnamed protein product [Rotaria magnacalcarata]CAF3741371.1 unnamed protein product [Rotaria magnacalcarata]
MSTASGMYLLLVVLFSIVNGNLARGVNGGVDCASCTIVVGVIEHLSILYNETIVTSLERFCNYLPSDIKTYCKVAVDYLGPIIVEGFLKNETPDIICHSITLCRDDPGQPECRLFSSKSLSNLSHSQRGANLRQRYPWLPSLLTSKACDLPGIKEICKIFEEVFNNHMPLVDIDGDRFGTEESFRGSAWRGKDCDDFSSKIRPGARSVMGDYAIDHNCNGIYGMDSSTNKPWEEEFCNDTQRLGIAVLGDSVSAHFHIPEQWLDARQLSVGVFEHLVYIIGNELDWPQLSGTTGHINNTWPNIEGSTRSLFARLFELDHCNHRDYQNIAVNGANSKSILDIAKTLTRDQQNDVPLLVIYSLVGNDVCNGHNDTIAHMTTYEEMYNRTLTGLAYLDTVLPIGSHVLTTGLANGSILYDLLHDRVHPLGRVGPPITYSKVYSYLECLEISPCNGWLSSNDTLRAFTSERAVNLSIAVHDATNTYSPKNFDSGYLDFPFDQAIQEWISQGGEPWQLIESVDGFHISQYGHAITSDVIWSWLQSNKPHWLPPANPHNADIERVFKDQGGY